MQQHHFAIRVWHPKGQHLGHKFADLPRREVHHRDHLFAHERFRRVVARDLGRGAASADLRPEIDGELDRGLARFGESFGRGNRTGADVDLEEIVEY